MPFPETASQLLRRRGRTLTTAPACAATALWVGVATSLKSRDKSAAPLPCARAPLFHLCLAGTLNPPKTD
jgi:hypothetical protein